MFLRNLCFTVILLTGILSGACESPYVYYRYSGVVSNSSGTPLSSVLVRATFRDDYSKTLNPNRTGNVTEAFTDDEGNYTIQVGYRGSWQLALVFTKSGYSQTVENIESDNIEYSTGETILKTLNVTLSQ